MNWYLQVFMQYAVFDGRARRQEFWMFALSNIVITIGVAIVDGVVGMHGTLNGLYCLAILLPSIGVAIRRLHDTGRPGWWILVGLVPLIGAFVLLIFYVQDSQPDANLYGPNPKSA